MPELGIVIVSHSADIAKGLVSLIREVAPDDSFNGHRRS